MPYPQLVTFDAPDGLLTCSRRERSNSPLQALTLLNDPVFFEAAQALAVRILRECQRSPEERLNYAIRLCLGRSAHQAEIDRLLQYYQSRKAVLAGERRSVDALFPPEGVEGIDRVDVAALAGVTSIILNLEEFVTRE
jgi:hypothetical protein